MSKTKLKESSHRFLKLLRLSIVSFVSMGILIGYHGAPLINSLIGVFWFVFAVTAGMVVTSALSKEIVTPEIENPTFDKLLDDTETMFAEKRNENRRRRRADYRQKVSDPA